MEETKWMLKSMIGHFGGGALMPIQATVPVLCCK